MPQDDDEGGFLFNVRKVAERIAVAVTHEGVTFLYFICVDYATVAIVSVSADEAIR